MSKLKPLEFDVAGQIEVDNHIVPGTGDYFTIKIRGSIHTSQKQDRDFVEKLGEAAVLAQIDGTRLLQELSVNDVAGIIHDRFEHDDIRSLIDLLEGLV